MISVVLIPLVGILLSGLGATEAVKEDITVGLDGIDFEVAWYDDGRSKPYRVKFREDGVLSIYKFNEAGAVKNIRAGSEKYKVTYDSSGDLKAVKLKSSRRRFLGEEYEEGDFDRIESIATDHRRLYACSDCEVSWDAVCDEGVPTVCDLVSFGSPILANAESLIETFCETFGAACSSNGAEEVCAGQCDTGLNACLDSTNNDYRCFGDTILGLSDCGLVDDDAADLPACFEAFGKEKIDRVYIQRNPLTTLPVDTFEGLSNVANLHLSFGEFKYFPEGLFTPMAGTLYGLSLNDNAVEYVDERLFAGLTTVNQVHLGNNLLAELPAELFFGIPQLREIFAFGNQLTTLPEDIFSELWDLEFIWLQDNNLTMLPKGLFAGNTDVDQVRLTNNDLTTLPEGIFTPITGRFSSLHLRGNPNLQCVPATNGSNIIHISLDSEDLLDGTCECMPAEAITCDEGLSCQPGVDGYTCE